MLTANLELNVSDVRAEARDIISIELKASPGKRLPAFTPGAHLEIELETCDGRARLTRHYSLCNSSAENDRYVVAIARAEASRGGSLAAQNQLRIGSRVNVRGPRNNFELTPDAEFYRFIAGGIGITPILSMIHWCNEREKRWSLLYCTRSRNRAAFYETLRSFGKAVRFHFDDEAEALPDIEAEMSSPESGEHVFCCGPAPLMEAVSRSAVGRPADSVHFEWFGAAVPEPRDEPSNDLEVVLERSGMRLSVPGNRTVLELLLEHGVTVQHSCKEGVCGSCEIAVLAGEIDHRDHVLSKAERAANKTMMICVSRGSSSSIHLDL